MTIPQLMGERRLVVDEEWAVERVDFRRVYGETWPEVFRYAWVLVRHRQDAEDVASEAFRRGFESWNAGHGPRGEILPWLFLITRRVAIDRLRRRRLISWLPVERVTGPEVSADEAAFRRSKVWIWFDQLCRAIPANQREALLLRFHFDLSTWKQRRSWAPPPRTSGRECRVAWPRFEHEPRAWSDEQPGRRRNRRAGRCPRDQEPDARPRPVHPASASL